MADHSHAGHRQRHKKRFLKTGLDSFEHHEVLELLLYNTIPQKDTNELAHDLLSAFGSISAVFDASYEDLCAVKGVGEVTASLIKLIPEISRVYLDDKAQPCDAYDTSDKLCALFLPKFVGRMRECLFVACMDNASRLIACELLLEGTSDSVPLPVKEIVQFSYSHNAPNIAIAHNHPLGLANPSVADRSNTCKLNEALSNLRIRLIDHIIVGKAGDALSMAEYRMLS